MHKTNTIPYIIQKPNNYEVSYDEYYQSDVIDTTVIIVHDVKYIIIEIIFTSLFIF